MRDTESNGSLPSERFRVSPAVVTDAAGQVGELADGARQAQSYASSYLLMTNSGASLITTLCEWIYDLEGTMGTFFGDLSGVLDQSETGLTESAQMYRTTDRESAARLDRAYWSH